MSQNAPKGSFVSIIGFFADCENEGKEMQINCPAELLDRVAETHKKLLETDTEYSQEYAQFKVNSAQYCQNLRSTFAKAVAIKVPVKLFSIFARVQNPILFYKLVQNQNRLQAIYERIKDEHGLSHDLR